MGVIYIYVWIIFPCSLLTTSKLTLACMHLLLLRSTKFSGLSLGLLLVLRLARTDECYCFAVTELKFRYCNKKTLLFCMQICIYVCISIYLPLLR